MARKKKLCCDLFNDFQLNDENHTMKDALSASLPCFEFITSTPVKCPTKKRVNCSFNYGDVLTYSDNNINKVLDDSSLMTQKYNLEKIYKDEKDGFFSKIKGLDILEIQKLAEMKSILSEILVDKLENLNIKVTWQVPELHISKTLNDKSRCNESNDDIDRFPYSKEEVKFIRKRWHQFCKLYNFEKNDFRGFFPNIIAQKHLSSIQKCRFVQFIGQDLPHRTLTSIYRKFENSTAEFVKGSFALEEDALILSLYGNRVSKPLSIASKILDRPRYIIWRRLKRILNNRRDFHFLLKMQKKKKRELELKTILNKVIGTKTEWAKKQNAWKEDDLNKIDLKLSEREKALWLTKVLPCLQGCPLGRSALAEHIIKEFHQSKWSSWEEVSWKDLSIKTYSLGIVFLYGFFRTLVKKYVPPDLWCNLDDCVQFLYGNFLECLQEEAKNDCYLKQFTLKNRPLKFKVLSNQ